MSKRASTSEVMRIWTALSVLLDPSLNCTAHHKSLEAVFSLKKNNVESHNESLLKPLRLFSSSSCQIHIKSTGCTFYIKKPGRSSLFSMQKDAFKEIFEIKGLFLVSKTAQISSPGFSMRSPQSWNLFSTSGQSQGLKML